MTDGLPGLIGVSPQMVDLYDFIKRICPHTHPILILGESGTGKELVARAIHQLGPRAGKPFVPVDCAALPPTLIECELFGHIKGAFTGASQNKPGLFAISNDGTLFLDEIGELPPDAQTKLLRALQEKEIRPVGSLERFRINARIIAATNRDLEAAMRIGTFRQDLFFRLSIIQINLPPLRERKSDIPRLVEHFLKILTGPHPPPTFSQQAMERLMAHDWPGNVRELQHVIERAAVLNSGEIVQESDLPFSHHRRDGTNLQPQPNVPLATAGTLQDLERRAIFQALRETDGDKISAAHLLGIGKTTLYRKLKEYAQSSPQT